MHQRNRFLLKTILISLGLFAIWGPVSKLYGVFLTLGLKSFDPMYAYVMKEIWLYNNSLFLIPLISLAIATPNVQKMRKAAFIGIGIVMLIVIDSIRIRFEIGDAGPSSFYAVYHSLKLLLPFILWIIMLSPDFLRMFEQKEHGEQLILISCPLCGEDHDNIMDHLQVSHGSKSLKYKKVRKLCAKYPHLALK